MERMWALGRPRCITCAQFCHSPLKSKHRTRRPKPSAFITFSHQSGESTLVSRAWRKHAVPVLFFPDKCSTRQITVPTLGQHARSASPWRQAKVQVWIGRMRCWDGSFGTRNKPLPGFMRDRSPVMKRAGRCARCALCLFEVKICDSRVLHSWTRCLKPCRISDYYHVCKIKAASTRRDVKA